MGYKTGKTYFILIKIVKLNLNPKSILKPNTHVPHNYSFLMPPFQHTSLKWSTSMCIFKNILVDATK